MTTTISEGNVSWTFEDPWIATKYDDWSFYRNQFQRCADSKAMDLLALEPGRRALWMIEAKDYTFERRSDQKEPLWVEVGRKARDTLAGVLAASVSAVDQERDMARGMCTAARVRVVLHMEQPTNPSKLFPQSFDPADLQQKLRQQARAIDPRARVVDHNTPGLPWSAAWTPTRSAPSPTPYHPPGRLAHHE
jgi:hypothetical protein